MDRMPTRMTFDVDDEDAFYRRRDELAHEFAGWLLRTGRAHEQTETGSCVSDLELLLDWRWGYGDGDLARWDEGELTEFLLSWCPRKLSASPAEAAEVPDNLATAMVFWQEAGLLRAGSSSGDALAAHARDLHSDFVTEMGNPANFGMAKSLVAQAGDIDLEDPLAMQRMIDEFNALPDSARSAILDPALGGPRSQLPEIGPMTLPSRADLLASAEAAPVLTAFDLLVDYFAAPGKPLTKTGAIKIADAVALAGLLDTGETLVDQIGDQTFRKGSAREFGRVYLWLTWARECGALRSYRGRMVAVKTWQRRRRADPVAICAEAALLVVQAGPLNVSQHGIYTETHHQIDLSTTALMLVLAQAHVLEAEEIAQRTWAVLEAQSLSEPWPGAVAVALDRVLTMLERAGLVRREGAQPVAGVFGSHLEGGTVRMTPIGAQVAADLVETLGYPVQRLPPAAEQSVVQLVDQTVSLDVDQWWAIAGDWLDAQPDDAVAAEQLVDELAGRELFLLVSTLDGAPRAAQDRLIAVLDDLRSADGRASDEVSMVILSWMISSDAIQPDDVDADEADRALIVVLGASCDAGEGQSVATTIAALGREAGLALIGHAGRFPSPRSVSLLDALGRHHQDRHLAKSARKELFRLRDRMAGLARASR